MDGRLSGLSAKALTSARTSIIRRVADGITSLHRPLLAAAVFAALIALIASVGYFADTRELVGVPIWHKAAKFGISITIYTLTIAWMLQFLPRRSRLVWWLGTSIAIAITIELLLIVLQIIRGQMSHFNVSTPFDAGIYYTMGGFIAGVWMTNLVLGIHLALRRMPDRTAASGIRWGTAIGLIGMALAFAMTVGEWGIVDMDTEGLAGAHSIGAADGGPTMPITGWNTESGDMRVPHFLGLHGLQAIPAFAIILSLLARRRCVLRDEATRVRLVRIFAFLYFGIVIFATVQAVRGHSVVGTDWTIPAALVGLAVLASAAVMFGCEAFRELRA